ncbi:hypothetical protein JCM1841_006996 [Sporobolomyces salmonicolor]
MAPTVADEQPCELASHSPAAVPVFASDASFNTHLPKPLRHPKPAPTRSPTSRPAAAPPLADSNRADGPRVPYPRSPSAASTARLSGFSAHTQMLPSHPAALPNMYDSTASTSEGGAGSSDEEPGVGHSYMSERRRREEARARRRAKHASSTTASLTGALNGSIGRKKAESVGQRAGVPPLGTSSRRVELKGVGIEATGNTMPTVFGQEGLGLVVGLADADYQASVDDASLPPLNSRSVLASTYSSSLGSAVPSPALSASAFPTHSRNSSHHLRETSEPAITFQSSFPVPFTAPHSPHAHFLPSQLPQETRVHSQSRQIERTGSVALQPDHIIFPTTLSPESPASTSISRRPSSTFSFSGAAVPCSSPTTSVSTQASKRNSIRLTPGSPRARSPRRAAGPTTIVGDMLIQQEPSRLYFPPPPSKPRTSIASPDPPVVSSGSPNVFPSPAQSTSSKLYFPPAPRAPGDSGSEQPFSPVSSTFPSRGRQSSAHSASSAPSSHRTVFPSAPIPPSPATSTFSVGPFPPPPSHSPHARFLSRLPQSAADFPASPSYSSTLSAMSTNSIEPVFPTLGAQLHADGVVRASAASRRVSPAPWEDAGRNAGDELDRMMRAQRRTASDEEGKVPSQRERAKEKERKRKSIYQELIRAQGQAMPPLPTSPQGQHEDLDSFQRELFARDTVKKSLGSGLLSEQPSLPPSEVGDERDEDLDSVENLGLTSSSTSSDISTLPSFPDVPTHAYQPVTPSPPPGSYDNHDEVEVVLSQHSSTEATVRPIGKTSPRKQLHRLSMSSSGHSLYEDASEDSSATTQEETSPPRLEMARQQTSLWVLDTLASTVDGSGRKLNDIGEEEEEAEEILQLPVHSPPATPLAPTFPSISTPPFASKLVFPSPASSQALPNPPPSPTLSQGSYSTSSSVAAVSFILPRRAEPTSSATSLPLPNTTTGSSSSSSKSKLKLPKKLGALFGSSPSYNAAALGIRGHGISSRDIARLTRPDPEGGFPGAAVQHQQHQILAGQQKPRASLDWDARSRSTSFSSGGPRPFPLVGSGAPASVPSTPTFPTPEFRVTPPSGRPSLSSEQLSLSSVGGGGGRAEPLDAGAGKLADLLSRFEKEEKERIRGIATARSKHSAVGVI